MEQARLAFTAVYLKSNHGYVGFIEELPGVNSIGRTLEEARETLHRLAAGVFDEERPGAEEPIAGKDVVRETFVMLLHGEHLSAIDLHQERGPAPAKSASARHEHPASEA